MQSFTIAERSNQSRFKERYKFKRAIDNFRFNITTYHIFTNIYIYRLYMHVCWCEIFEKTLYKTPLRHIEHLFVKRAVYRYVAYPSESERWTA